MNKKVQDHKFERAMNIKSSGGIRSALAAWKLDPLGVSLAEGGIAGKAGTWLTPGLHIDTSQLIQHRNKFLRCD